MEMEMGKFVVFSLRNLRFPSKVREFDIFFAMRIFISDAQKKTTASEIEPELITVLILRRFYPQDHRGS